MEINARLVIGANINPSNIEIASSLDQLTDHKKNIATRFAQGKLTQEQKIELDRAIISKQMKLK